MNQSANNTPRHPQSFPRHARAGEHPAKNDNAIDYHHLALIQIHEAIEQYLKSTLDGFICAITLAGAAEEILGKFLDSQNKPRILDELSTSLSEKIPNAEKKQIIASLNLARNALKHVKEEICDSDFDPELAAQSMISRAIMNWAYLTETKTDPMEAFINKIETKLPDARLRGHDNEEIDA